MRNWFHKKIRKLIRMYFKRTRYDVCLKYDFCHNGCPYSISGARCVGIEIENILSEMDDR